MVALSALLELTGGLQLGQADGLAGDAQQRTHLLSVKVALPVASGRVLGDSQRTPGQRGIPDGKPLTSTLLDCVGGDRDLLPGPSSACLLTPRRYSCVVPARSLA